MADYYEHLRKDSLREHPVNELAPVPFDPRARILIAVNSCWKDLDSNQSIRDTWGATLPENWDLRFFIGGRNFTKDEEKRLMSNEFIGSPGTLGAVSKSCGKLATIGDRSELLPDEILLPDVPDGYLGLPWKTVESLKWALDEKYDGIFRAFVDTYLFPDRLLKAGFPHDAIGWSFGCGPCPAHTKSSHSCPLGGAGYWTSPKAAKAIIDPSNCKSNPLFSTHWGEDTMVGFALHRAGIPLVHDPRYVYNTNEPPEFNRSKISIHLCDRGSTWSPKLMLATHVEQEKAKEKWTGWDGTCKRCKGMVITLHPRGPRCKQCGVFV